MKRIWAGGLGLALGFWSGTACAQDSAWRLTPNRAPAAVPLPRVTLGLPVAVDDAPARPQPNSGIAPVSYQPAPIVRGQTPDNGWTPVAPPTAPNNAIVPTIGVPIAVQSPPQPITSVSRAPVGAEEPYNHGAVAGNPIPPPPPGGAAGHGGGWGNWNFDWLGSTTGGGRKIFESDHCFDNFISPITNPFLFEDPRALTEVRVINIFQHSPNSNTFYNGGNIDWFGIQARLAVTERLSFVINKLGFIWNDPKNGGGVLGNDAGFAELWLGPKYTFWRDDHTGTIAAAGVTFQVPTGSAKVAQDTGSLSITPYISFAQNFYKDFNFLTTVGYSIGDSERTDYLYSSFHLDYDVGGLHKIYPLIEMNWFSYTGAGNSRPTFGFEGRDLINFGSNGVSGTNSLSLAVGARYKFSECMQTGAAVEFPLIASHDLLNFRLTIDFTLRY